jgi:hypothetical protein
MLPLLIAQPAVQNAVGSSIVTTPRNPESLVNPVIDHLMVTAIEANLL